MIPTYNYAHYILRATDSVLAQTFYDLELIVVDDGSTDNTREILAAYGDRLDYVFQPNQGPYAACRTGLGRSRGTYLIFLDADDRLAPSALAVLDAEIEKAPDVRMVFGRFWSIHPDGRRRLSPAPRLRSPERNFRDFLDGKLRVCTGAAAMHREVFAKLLAYREPVRTGMDVACLARTLLCFPCRAVDAALLEVYHHEGRLRDDLEQVRAAGLGVVDAVFDPKLIPARALKYRQRYLARFQRERMRLLYRAGRYDETLACYREAVRADWRSLLDGRNLRRCLRAWLCTRGGQTAKPTKHEAPAASRRPGQSASKTVAADGAHRVWGHRLRLQQDPIGFLGACAREHGDVVRLRLGRLSYLLSSPADIRHVLATNRLNYVKTGFQTAFKRFFGKGLLTSEADEHLTWRRRLQPLFQRESVETYSDAIVTSAARLLDRWKDGDTVDVADEMMRLTVGISGKIVFGLEDSEGAPELYHAVRRSHQRLIRRMQSRLPFPEWVPTFRNRRYRRQIGELDILVSDIVRRRRGTGRIPSVPEGDDLLGKLLRVSDSAEHPLSDRQLRDHLLSIFLAAYEPTANALTWCWYLLAKHPDAYARLLDELKRVVGTRLPCAEDIPNLCYTQRVIAETLRLYPSTWLLARRAVEADSLPSGVNLRRGDEVLISPYLVQRDPRHFDEPERFRPERFEQSPEGHRAAYRYLPFGAGARVCIGEPLARLELALLLATVAPRFRMAQPTSCEVRPESVNLFTIQPKGPVLMRLHRTPADVGTSPKSAAPLHIRQP